MIPFNKSIALVSGSKWHRYGADGCKINYWDVPPSGTGAAVYVICHERNGNLEDSYFSIG
jgi:hypothetical protein